MSGNDPVCTGLVPPAAQGGPVGLALARTARMHRSAAGRRLRELGLYPGQELMMMRLWGCGPVRQSDLIQSLGVDASTVTKMLQRLELCGHVRRGPDPADRRAVLVEATEESRALRTAVEGVWTDLETLSLHGLTPADGKELARLLDLVTENLRGEAEEGAGTGPGPGEGC
ncbi:MULTISPECIES: MarR family winged helix-turn-helix transcriptional regulator [unclassified Streptomyces]|uniref:MarR family winged helix-turn-helix transcriptional regulator n=1 Tax=unclassified Streptomyces TaxID=2593676 RepID=UPI00166042E5|nr:MULTISPECIES: MarR family winged helix-turn-helix transcriptional regulator [unclassified Streptomyces]MBD0709258.1 MarR family transcriptional regulator [Streptomyces sp. CBMA291]MBD0713589.1 MarR family transcriptional regulator [Streptomyces sp. CBMA370]